MARNVWAVLCTACQEPLQVQLQDDVTDMEKTCTELLGILTEETEITHVVDDVSKIIKEQAITYAEGLDKICFIIDRDRESFVSHPGNDQYSYVLNKCKDNDFGFYLSNPCFEFWLLLHFDEVVNLDMEQLLENPKITSKRRYTEQQLRTRQAAFVLNMQMGIILILQYIEDISRIRKTLIISMNMLEQSGQYVVFVL